MKQLVKQFFQFDAAGGIILAMAAILAMIIANTPLVSYYHAFFDAPVAFQFGPLKLAKPAYLWINDGLMAIFFFLVGLELKREVLVGELSNIKTIVLPALAALGGMAAPALIYYAINRGNPDFLAGWAIPAATDIAFALGVLSLLGKNIPSSLKVFLISIAIFDDIGAILIIALFYTSNLSLTSLAIAAVCLVILFIFNKRGVMSSIPYMLIGLIMWVAVLKSGIHATLAGVLLALFIPLKNPNDPNDSPLQELEHDLHGTVAFMILPLFAFANSGITLVGSSLSSLLHPVPLGIAAGLFFGKQIGILWFSWLGIKLKLASMPQGIGWKHIYGVSLLCGIGFTMSLFIGGLAFGDEITPFDERLGIIIGSLLSGIVGYVYLRYVVIKPSANISHTG